MFAALQNVWNAVELRKKIIFTLMMFAVFRFGAHIPVPGIDSAKLAQLFGNNNLFDLMDLFAGGSLSKFSIFAMSITPYINASIIMQLLGVVVPTIERWGKEGEEGRKKITQTVRYGTVILAFIQGVGMSYGFSAAMTFSHGFISHLLVATILTAGTVFLMWIGEQITENGVGNGISLLIFAGIVARLPSGIYTIFEYVRAGTINIISAFAFVLMAAAMVLFVIWIQQGQRKIPVQYAKRVVGRRVYGGQSTYLPLKVNQAGVIPIIFASSILMFPLTIAQFTNISWIKAVAGWFAWGSVMNTAFYILFIIFFTYFYTAVTFNVPEVAENMKKNGGFIPGLRPGKPTAEYLERVMSRITLAGAVFLALIAVVPNGMGWLTGVQGVYFGGTALLIVVGVALDTMKQIEAMILQRHYQGFMK
ncbi:MAG: preprotein translocase subunit SecY [Negativicutes bacterium]